MKARFLHMADSHLGYRQYNNTQRYNDFARAFLDVIDTAITEKVDFVILAGDLFQKRSIQALTLNQAVRGLEKLQDANIPCIAVEGNHELAYQDETIGWMEFLATRRLITLLNANFEDGVAQLARYGTAYKRGSSYIDPMPGLRVHGLKYFGSGIGKALDGYAQALSDTNQDGVEYTIFIAHAGLEGVISGDSGGVSYRQWSVLQPHVDYLALGHIHKPFDRDDWIYNPGSTETCSIAEAAWPKRGYYLVEIDTDSVWETDQPKHQVTLHANRRRPFYRLHIKVDHDESPEALNDHCRQFLQRRLQDLNRPANSPQPVVEFQLTGVLAFDRSAQDLDHVQELLVEIFNPLVPLVKNFTQATEFAIEVQEGLGRPELERQVLIDLLNQDAQYREQSQQWASLATSLKTMALSGATGEAIVDELASRVEIIDNGQWTIDS